MCMFKSLLCNKSTCFNYYEIQIYFFQSPKPKDVDEVLHLLSENILNPNYTEHIGFHFSYLLLFIIPKAILYGSEENTHEYFCRNCIALSKLIKYSPDVLK